MVVLSALQFGSLGFETIQSPLGYTAIARLCHTPDCLDKCTEWYRGGARWRARIITVVGAVEIVTRANVR